VIIWYIDVQRLSMNHGEVWSRHNIFRKQDSMLILFKICSELKIRIRENILILFVYWNLIDKSWERFISLSQDN